MKKGYTLHGDKASPQVDLSLAELDSVMKLVGSVIAVSDTPTSAAASILFSVAVSTAGFLGKCADPDTINADKQRFDDVCKDLLRLMKKEFNERLPKVN